MTYVDYVSEYERLHALGKKFSGFSLERCIDDVEWTFSVKKPKRILDYGCGKGLQYTEKKLHLRFSDEIPFLYDVGVPQFRTRPEGLFSGIICTDVMEHIDERDVDTVLADIFSFATDDACLFFNIATVPAKSATLSDGRNVHLTLKPRQWWEDSIAEFTIKEQLVVVSFDGGRYV